MLMRNFILLFIAIMFMGIPHAKVFSQTANGGIYADTNNLLIIKVGGTHHERGVAQGELLGSKITDIMHNYVKPQFGSSTLYNQVRAIVSAGSLFSIDSVFIEEAKGVIIGMNYSNTNTQNLDYVDIILANCILDIQSILQAKEGMECSSLMSWGDATANGDLNGKSIITRHLDWIIDPVLTRNQVMVIHIPSEVDEQPWAEVGFAGMISVLSGFNSNIGVFQHMMSDDNSHGVLNGNYEPIWFTLRKAIEKVDPNQDGENNVNDVKHYIDNQPQGFADGYIISALARSTEIHDSLVAMVAEIASAAPFITYRSNAFADSIPSDNLYTANNQIARNNSMNLCFRYNGVKNNIGNGTTMSLDNNRDLMADYSHLNSNYQFMTFVPENDLFRISIRENIAAYLSDDMDLNIIDLFEDNVFIEPTLTIRNKEFYIYPNPTTESINIDADYESYLYQIIDNSGRIIQQGNLHSKTINVENIANGLYHLIVFNEDKMQNTSFIKR